MIEMYDVGRVLIKPFTDGYRFIAEQGSKYISDQDALERIVAFHRDRSKKIDQVAFNMLNHAWVEAIRRGELTPNPQDLVYSDVKPRFDKVKSNGGRVFLHTSGSKELTEHLLGDECGYDEILVASETGDKNDPETFANIWEYTKGCLRAFFDDKPSVLQAAYDGFRLVKAKPTLYLIDRLEIVGDEMLRELESKGVTKITSFDEV